MFFSLINPTPVKTQTIVANPILKVLYSGSRNQTITIYKVGEAEIIPINSTLYIEEVIKKYINYISLSNIGNKLLELLQYAIKQNNVSLYLATSADIEKLIYELKISTTTDKHIFFRTPNGMKNVVINISYLNSEDLTINSKEYALELFIFLLFTIFYDDLTINITKIAVNQTIDFYNELFISFVNQVAQFMEIPEQAVLENCQINYSMFNRKHILKVISGIIDQYEFSLKYIKRMKNITFHLAKIKLSIEKENTIQTDIINSKILKPLYLLYKFYNDYSFLKQQILSDIDIDFSFFEMIIKDSFKRISLLNFNTDIIPFCLVNFWVTYREIYLSILYKIVTQGI